MEENLRFAADRVRDARGNSALGDDAQTFGEEVVLHFIGGVHRPMFQHYVRYALSSKERGAALVQRYSVGTDIRAYLDVGCAYGGCPIAMAVQGVPRAVGIEIDSRLLKLARSLAKHENVADSVDLRHGDLTKEADIVSLGTFDLVTCLDVLEHVLEPRTAIKHLARLTEPGGTLVVDVPNLYSHARIRQDPHHKIFGSVLLNRDDAIRVFEDWGGHRKHYGVGYFYPLEWYIGELSKVGFEVEVLDKPSDSPEDVRNTLHGLHGLRDELTSASTNWPQWRTKLVSTALDAFFAQMPDLRASAEDDPAQFQLRHAVETYHLKCRREAAVREAPQSAAK